MDSILVKYGVLADKVLNDLKKDRETRLKLMGRKPSGLKASIVYILMRKEGYSISMSYIAKQYKVSTETLRKNLKILKKYLPNR